MEIKILSVTDMRKVFNQEDSQVLYKLGLMFLKGERVPKDDAKAAKWFHKAAERGNVDAMYQLGEMYRYGEGVPIDDAEAINWYRKAGESEDGLARLMKRIR